MDFMQSETRVNPVSYTHLNHPLPPGAEQMILVQQTYNFFLFIQNGIAGGPLFQDNFLHIVHQVIQVEGNQTLPAADPADGGGVVNEAHRPVGIAGGGKMCIRDRSFTLPGL